MIDAYDYKHECPEGCDCPDAYDPKQAAKVRRMAGRILTLMQRHCPGTFAVVWEHMISTAGYMRVVRDNYFFNIGPDRWLRAMRINADNSAEQLTVFSAWLYKDTTEGINYHMDLDDEFEALERFLDQQLVLEDMARL